MLWLSHSMGSRKQRGVTPRVSGPSLGLNGHGDFGATRSLVHMIGPQSQVWDGELVLRPQECVTEVVVEMVLWLEWTWGF